MKILIFSIIFVFQILILILIGFSYQIFYELFNISFWLEKGFLIACIGYCICGISLHFFNRKFINMKAWQFLIIILSSYIFIIFLFVLCLGSVEIGPIKIPSTKFDSLTLRFWAFIFHAKGDPMRVVGLGFITIPALFIFTPLSFYIMDFIFKRISKN
jgi:hypothetical protein